MAKSTAGTEFCVVKDGATTGVSVTPTGASKAAPCEISTASTGTLKNGDLIWIPAAGTGLSEVDGKWWVITNLVADTTFDLLGSDTTASTGTFAAGVGIKGHGDADMECLCLSSISFNRDQPDTISTATFCDTTSSIPGSATSAGSIDFGGYVDITDTDYKALLALEASGAETAFRVMLPNNGYIVFPATINQITVDIPLEGAVAYSGSATLKSAARHLFA
jgi:hypothetical protein